MSRTDAWMPLYIGDYLADTMHLDARGHGAYLLLLMHYWRNGPLPDDDRQLAGIARVSRKVWAADVGPLMRTFFEARDGLLHQKRADAERLTATQNSDKRRAAGKRGGDAKSARTSALSGKVSGGGGGGGFTPETTQKPYINGAIHPENGPNQVITESDRDCSNARFLPGGLLQQNPTPRAGASPSPSPSKEESSLRDAPPAAADAPDGTPATHPAIAMQGPSARQVLFGHTLWLLQHMTGRREEKCRSLLGLWLRDTGDDAELVNRIVQEAANRQVIGPVDAITKAVQALGSAKRTRTQAELDRAIESEIRRPRTSEPRSSRDITAGILAVRT